MKLIISNTIEVPVRFSYKDGGKQREFSITLYAERLSQDELERVAKENDKQLSDTLRERVTGWKSQNLVVDDEGKPVDFSAEALELMLSVLGLPGEIFRAYIDACLIKGKAKN